MKKVRTGNITAISKFTMKRNNATLRGNYLYRNYRVNLVAFTINISDVERCNIQFQYNFDDCFIFVYNAKPSSVYNVLKGDL